MQSRQPGRTGPTVVPISDLRRRVAGIIELVNKEHVPVFVAQRGYVTAVLLSREDFDALHQLENTGGNRGTSERAAASLGTLRPLPTILQERRPEDDYAAMRIWTQYGFCDYETASILADHGVDTELVLTEEGWQLDDEG